MNKRASMTLVICTVSAGVALIGLGRPATQIPSEAAPAVASAQSGAYGNDEGGPAAVPRNPAVISIQGFAFGGSTVARPGEALSVTNGDSVPHTLTAANRAFDTGTIDGGASRLVTLPTEPGTYQLFCSIHPSMTFSITVQA